MSWKSRLSAVVMGAVLALTPSYATAADRGGHGGGGFRGGGINHSARGFSEGRAFSGREGHFERHFDRGYHFRGGYFYGAPGFSFGFYGTPYYGYGPGYYGSGCGYYDQWGNWIPSPYCYPY